MVITRDATLERELFDTIRAAEDKKIREGMHLSDLISPRKAYWQRVQPLPLTDEEIMYFLTGRGHEEAMHDTTKWQHVESRERCGISYSMDFYQGFPIELKTRRRGLAAAGGEEEEYEHYIAQLRGYCALERTTRGRLYVWCLVSRMDGRSTKPELACYDVTFTLDEINETMNKLLVMKSKLNVALEFHTHEILPLCAEWMCGKVKRATEVKPYCGVCKKDFSNDRNLLKHMAKNEDHHGTFGAYKYTYEPRCKWFNVCRPECVIGETK